MRNLLCGITIGFVLGVGSAAVLAQRAGNTYPDAVTAEPEHYSVSFKNRQEFGQ